MANPSREEQLMLELINEERANEGLKPLKFNGDLLEASEDHSEWMLTTDTFSHNGEGGSSAGDRIEDAGYVLEGNWTWGENIAWQTERGAAGIEDDVRALHESLMQSPGHRANILNPDYDEIGIGIERGNFEGRDSVMITQNFAASDAEPDVTPNTPADPEPTSPREPDPAPPIVAEEDPPTTSTPEETPTEPVITAEPNQPFTTLFFADFFQDVFNFGPNLTTLFDSLDFAAVPTSTPVPSAPVEQPVSDLQDRFEIDDVFTVTGFDGYEFTF